MQIQDALSIVVTSLQLKAKKEEPFTSLLTTTITWAYMYLAIFHRLASNQCIFGRLEIFKKLYIASWLWYFVMQSPTLHIWKIVTNYTIFYDFFTDLPITSFKKVAYLFATNYSKLIWFSKILEMLHSPFTSCFGISNVALQLLLYFLSIFNLDSRMLAFYHS